jgi:hypothetical protein
VAQAREQLSLTGEARIPREEGELERDGAVNLLSYAEGAIDGAVSALALPSHHAPIAYLSACGKM